MKSSISTASSWAEKNPVVLSFSASRGHDGVVHPLSLPQQPQTGLEKAVRREDQAVRLLFAQISAT